ncbi:MAG: MFS transporter [Pseudomonadota bacterium]
MRLPALQSVGFRRYVAGTFFSLQGLWIQRIVFGWLAWDLTHSAFWVGFLSFLLFAPTIVSGPLFGVLADRVDVRSAALVTQSLQAFLSLTAFILQFLGLTTIGSLCAICLAIGTVTSAHHPLRMTMAPRLVARDALTNAVAITSVNFNFARLFGPAIGGVLIAWIGVTFAMGVTVVCFLPFLFVLTRMTLRPRDQAAGTAAPFLQQLKEGVLVAWGNPIIRLAMVITGVFAVVGRGTLEILPAIADGAFERGAAGLGQIAVAGGAGALVASIVMATARPQTPGRLPLISLVSVFAGFALCAALGATDIWIVALAAATGIGFCGSSVGVGLQSAVQLSLTDAHRGRVMSLWTVLGIGGAAVGAITLGALADGIGYALALGVPALVGLSIVAGLLLGPGRGLSKAGNTEQHQG